MLRTFALKELSLLMVLNLIGLILDIIGVILLWKFGLPEDVSRTGQSRLVTIQSKQEEVNKAKLYDFLSKLALFLLILGFGFQIAGSLKTQYGAKQNQKDQEEMDQNKNLDKERFEIIHKPKYPIWAQI